MAMWIFTKALYAGEPLPLFNGGEMRRDFTYIDDIVRGVIACLDCSARRRRTSESGRKLKPACALQYREQPQRGLDAAG